MIFLVSVSALYFTPTSGAERVFSRGTTSVGTVPVILCGGFHSNIIVSKCGHALAEDVDTA